MGKRLLDIYAKNLEKNRFEENKVSLNSNS